MPLVLWVGGLGLVFGSGHFWWAVAYVAASGAFLAWLEGREEQKRKEFLDFINKL